jgi:hypothetical protein
METAITEIRLKIDGKVQRVMSAQQLIDLNDKNGINFAAGYLHLCFAEPWARTPAGEDALAWGMADVSSFVIEVDIASGRTSPSLASYALKSPMPRKLGAIKKWKRHVVAVSATGQYQVTTLPRIDAYSALHIQTSAISDISVKVGTIPEFEDLTREYLHDLLTNEGYSPQSDWTHLDVAAITSRVSDMWAMRNSEGQSVSEFRIDLNFTSTGNFVILSETIGERD